MRENTNPWCGWNISHQENIHGDLKPFDISGMLCTCGKRLVHKGIEYGCHILACPNPKCDRRYQIPIDNRQVLEYPGERILKGWKPPTVPPGVVKIITAVEITATPVKQKQYVCLGRDCGCDITKEQAERTFREHERALCVACENRLKKT